MRVRVVDPVEKKARNDAYRASKDAVELGWLDMSSRMRRSGDEVRIKYGDYKSLVGVCAYCGVS